MTRPSHPKTWNTEFVCSACSHRAPVQFLDPEAIAEDDPIGGRDKWTQQAALQAAQARLEKRGRRALGLVRCPSCGRSDQAIGRAAYLWAALPLVGVGPAAFILAMLAAMQLRSRYGSLPSPVLLALGMTLLVGGLVVLRGQRRLVREAATAVRFLKEETTRRPT